MNKVLNFFGEVRLELTKVTWPKREEVTRLTLVVFMISAFVGIFVGGLDFGLTKLLELAITRQ